jgi:uncharacterized protein with beta-barrel porin domain
MMNKAINTLVSAIVDSLKKFKNKLAGYVAIFAMIFGSTVGTMNAANAATVAVDAGGNIGGASATSELDADGQGDDAITLKDVETVIIQADTTVATVVTLVTGTTSLDIDSSAAFSLIVTSTIIAADATDLTIVVDAGHGLTVGGAITEFDRAADNQIVVTLEAGSDLTLNSATAATIHGLISGDSAGNGILAFTGSGAKTIDDVVGTTGLATVSVAAGASGILNEAVQATNLTVANTGSVSLLGTLIGNDGSAAAVTAMTGTSSTLNLNAITAKAITTSITAATVNGDGNIVVQDKSGGAVPGEAVISGLVGTTQNRIGSLKVGDGAHPGMLELDAASFFNSVSISGGTAAAEASILILDASLTATDGITLNDDGTESDADSTLQITSTATVTGTVNGSAAGEGILDIDAAATFANDVGGSVSIASLDIDHDATFNGALKAAGAMDVVASKTTTVKGDMTIGGELTVIGDLDFAGTATMTVDAFIQDGGTTGEIANANTSTGGVTFVNAIGTQVDGTVDALDIFAAATATKTILQSDDNQADEVNLVGTATIVIDRTILANETVFMDSAETVAGDIPATTKIFMPSNLKSGEGIYLLSDVTTVSTIAANVTAAAQDNAMYTYTATVVREADTANKDDVKITATARNTSDIASQLSTTKNEALGLYEASRAAADGVTNDTALVDLMSNMLNSQNGRTPADATALAKQVTPQTDTISGSAVATRAMTGTVQGIVSNRMASLRSGDAFVTGMSAGNGMSANSGFIQAFGSEGEQKNTGSATAKVYGFDTETSGLAIGFDGMTENGSTIGLSASYSATDVDGKGTGKSKNSIDSYTVSVYADKATDIGYIEGSLTYGINDNTSSRLVNTAGLSRSYSANYDSEQISLKVGGGVPNEVADGTFVTPFMSATVTNITTDAYTEKSNTATDNLRLKIAQDDINSLVGSLGVKAHMVTDKGTPMISLAVNNEFGDTTINSANTYQGGGTKFTTSTDVEELSATLGLGYSFGNDVTSLNINYEANVNDDEYLNQYGSIKIVAKF